MSNQATNSLFNFELDEAKDDFSRTRKLETKDGQIVTLQREDPYGMIRIVFSKGRQPSALSGQYTSFELAERDVIQYLNAKGKSAEAA